MNKIFFLDESGDLGLNGSNYFLICVILVDGKEYEKLKKILKKIKNRFKNLYKLDELKANKMTSNVKLDILRKTSNINYKIYSIVLNKNNVNNKLFLKRSKVNNIYIEVVSELFRKNTFEDCQTFEFDKFVPSNLEYLFHEKILNILGKENNNILSKENNNLNNNYSLKFLYSQQSKGIQFADLISWVIFQKFEYKNPKFLESIEDKCDIIFYKKKH